MPNRPKFTIRKTVANRVSRSAAEQAASFAGFAGEKIIQDVLLPSPRRTGRRYVRGGVVHQASSPGQAPVTDTGQLRQSVVSFTRREGTKAIATVGSPLAYGLALEVGNGRLRGPRPWISRLGTQRNVAALRRAAVAGLRFNGGR